MIFDFINFLCINFLGVKDTFFHVGSKNIQFSKLYEEKMVRIHSPD